MGSEAHPRRIVSEWICITGCPAGVAGNCLMWGKSTRLASEVKQSIVSVHGSARGKEKHRGEFFFIV